MSFKDNRFILVLLLIAFSFPAIASTQSPEQSALPEPTQKEIPLYKLNNEKLIEQAQQLLDETTRSFFADLRALATNKKLIERIQQTQLAFERSPDREPDPPAQGESPKVIKDFVDQAKSRLALRQQQKQTLEAEKTLWTLRVQWLTDGQRLVKDLLKKLEQLDLYLLEIQLRVADKTLDGGTVNLALRSNKVLLERQRQFQNQGETWRQLEQAARQDLEKLDTRMAKVNKQVIAAEVALALAQENYQQALKRTDLRQELAKERSPQLLNRIQRLKEDQEWLNGAFQLAYNAFTSQWAKAQVLVKTVTAEQAPENSELLQMDDELYDMVREGSANLIDRLQGLTDYFKQRREKLEETQIVLQQVVERGDVLKRDTDALNEHLFNLQILVDVYQERKDAAESLPADLKSGQQLEQQQRMTEKNQKALEAYQEAKAYLEKLAAEINKTRLSQESVMRQLALLKKAAESYEKISVWRSEFERLSKEDLLARYQETVEVLQKQRQELKPIREAAFEKQSATDEMTVTLESLQGPLFRYVQEQAIADRQGIEKKLYQIAELKIPGVKTEEVQKATPAPQSAAAAAPAPVAVPAVPAPAAAAAPTTVAVATPVATTPAALPTTTATALVQQQAQDPVAPLQRWGTDSTQALKGIGQQLGLYQGLLSSLNQIIQEQQQRRTQLLEALQAEKSTLDQYAGILNETLQLSRKALIAAIEIQRRLARQELTSADVPVDMIQAMDRESINQLEAELGALLKRQSMVQERLVVLNPQQENNGSGNTFKIIITVQEKFDTILKLVGRKLDRLQDRNKLLREQERKPADFTETEKKNLQEAALRRLESEDSFEDQALRFFASERAQSLTDLLEAYYAQVILLEDKLHNLDEQKKTLESLTRLTEDEKPVIKELIPLFQEYIARLKADYLEQEAMIEAALAPDKAKAIIADLKANNGAEYYRAFGYSERE